MSKKTSSSELDQEPYFSYISDQIKAGEGNTSITRLLWDRFHVQSSDKSIGRFRKRHSLAVQTQSGAYTKVTDQEAEAQTPATTTPILDDPDTMLRERGLDPEDWIITHMTPNMYEGPGKDESGNQTKITYYQTKFSCRKKTPPELQIVAPRTDGWVRPPKRKLDRSGARLIVVVGDQQAPFHDKNLHALFVRWLAENEPSEGISLGDSVDFPDISRHRMDPENTATVNECLQVGYDIFRDYVEASLDTHWTKLIGNHDERIRNLLLDKPGASPLYGIKRPDTDSEEGESVLDLEHLMRLDELGINVVRPQGKYDLSEIKITSKLAVRHGWIARQGSGASALATLNRLGYSIIVGHTHRQAVVHQTQHEIGGELRTLTGVEAGCMCRVSQEPDEDDGRIWPNYTIAPDWQQGFCTVEVFPDGFFNIDTAKYVNGVLLWRGQRYY